MLKSGWTWAARLVLARPPPPSSSSAGHPAVNVADPVAVGRVRSKGGGSDEDEEVLDRSKLLEWQELKLRSLQAMGEYVAGMAGAFRNLPGVAQQGRGRSGTAGGSGAAAGAEQAAAPPPPPPKFVIRQSKLVSKAEIDAITRRCLEELRDSGTPQRNLENLNAHLAQFPFAKGLATKLGAVAAVAEASSLRSSLLADSFRTPSMVDPSGVAKEVLARLGHVDPLPGRGIRILSIDGGGMKGLTALTLLRRLELETGRRIHELFDFFVGVSTGSIIVALLAFKKLPVVEVESLYRDMGAKVFHQTYFGGVTGIVKSHAYYDTSKFETLIKSFAGDSPLASAARRDCPKIAMVAALVSSTKAPIPYVFRSYNFPAMVTSNYRGSVRYKVWQAVRASSAAPGYFDEFIANQKIFQDGGVACNNATHVGIHEAQRLWPGEPIHCVVSIGMGKYDPLQSEHELEDQDFSGGTSLGEKFSKLLWSATDTETVHNTLQDLLEPKTYWRFNPHLSQRYAIDESRQQKIDSMVLDAKMYCQRNEDRIKKASARLVEKPTVSQSIKRSLSRKIEKPLKNILHSG